MTRIAAFAIGHPRRTILAGFVLTLAMGSGLTRLELDTDGQALVPRDAPEVLYDRQVRDTFDVEDQVAVVVETDDPAGIFNLRTLRLVDELTRELAAVPGIDPEEVTSLATEHSRWSGGRNALDFKTFLDPFPESAEDLAEIRDDLAGMGIYTGTLVSRDGEGQTRAWSPSATAILIGLESGADRALVHRRISRVVAGRGELEEKVHVVGAPIAESLLGEHILEDLATLVPIAILVMSLVFYLRYRSWVAVVLPMSEVAAALVFVFGLMGYLGAPVSLTITVMPVILTALGVADEIHIFDRYVHVLSRRTEDQRTVEGLRQTMEEMWRPVVKTSVTTSVGLLSFTLSPIAPVRHFGVFTAAGVLFCMVWSLTVIPAVLALRRRADFAAAAAPTWPQRFARSVDQVRQRRRVVLAGVILLVLAVPFGLGRLVVQDSWIDGFARTSPFRQSTEAVNRLFHGTHLLLVCLDAREGALGGELRAVPESAQVPERLEQRIAAAGLDPAALVGERVFVGAVPSEVAARRRFRERRTDLLAEVTAAVRERDRIRVELVPELNGSAHRFLTSRPDRRWRFFATGERMLDPRILERVRETGAFIEESLDGDGGVLDPYAQISVVRYILHGRREEERRIGATPLENRYLLNVFGKVRGPQRLVEMVDGARQQAVITVFLKNANFRDVGRLMNEIREHARTHLAPLGIRVGFAGDVAVSQTMIGAIVSTQTRSLLLSLLGIFLVAALLGRSLWLGLLCLFPPVLAVVLDFSLMGAVGIPLGVATSMFSAMTIGIGVDFAIHLTERWRWRAAIEPDLDERLREALAVTGPAILVNTLVIVLGFAVMTLSSVPANGRLGVLVIASVVACFLATVLLLPLLLVLPGRHGSDSPGP